MSIVVPNKQTAIRLNVFAREQMKHKLLNDILIDLTICDIENWDKVQYIQELKDLINSINIKK